VSSARPQYLGFEKPVSSIYDIRAVLDKDAKPANSSTLAELPAMEAVPKVAAGSRPSGGHGAPYLNLAISESLIDQSRSAREQHTSPSACIMGALLASEAYELLLGMSKTTALEALLEMHRAEVAAEVAFPGVRGDLSINERKRDLEGTLRQLFRERQFAHTHEARETYLSQFWADLRIAYRKGERFHAAEQANAQSLMHARWFPQLPATSAKWANKLRERIDGTKLWDWMQSIGTRTKCVLVRVATSARWLSAAAVILMLLGAAGYAWAGSWRLDPTGDGVRRFVDLLWKVMMSSFALELTNDLDSIVQQGGTRTKVVAVIHIGFSYILFGLMVSMLYRKITRS
jgi:hypothetical protein